MSDYRRAKEAGGTYFFTVATYRRQPILCAEDVRNALRDGINHARHNHPFTIDAWVLLPDHLHCIWTLPEGDADFSLRWAMIKRFVTKTCGATRQRNEWMGESKKRRHESTIWQRRFWEHQIRDSHDLERHMDYLHYNPVKHNLVSRVSDWPWSTFHSYARQSIYPQDWGRDYSVNAAHDYGER
ncbi:REP-associated tyrosine transposase [Desulfoluna spongiiphila]|uniref:REP-associated tyrosine transposase n=1 Tax=Desulfoluna spongiiphila TaxID=419481 RepID=UPI0012517649|nr:transposase [Desulfoluna spongiiphila]VVS95272.1 transposase is200-like [Desulfoluna spongiiphila]